ncbi:MAG: acylphosphatase [Nitrospirota bacterium]
MENSRVHLIIKGYVQGVFFRASTRDMAQSIGLTGWVKNLSGGSVEAVFEGPKDLLKEAIKWCHKGPAGASVAAVDEEWGEHTGEFKRFDIRW